MCEGEGQARRDSAAGARPSLMSALPQFSFSIDEPQNAAEER